MRRATAPCLVLLTLGATASAQPQPPPEEPPAQEPSPHEPGAEEPSAEEPAEEGPVEEKPTPEEESAAGEPAPEEPIEVEAGPGAQAPIEVDAGEPGAADDPDGVYAEPTPDPDEIEVSVFGSKREVSRVAGSAHRIDEEELERFEDDNIHRTLARVPGVYVRGEDGYGLRPNIGLRGGSSDRSKKITLMEDGVLMAPAPYSAPAAYYFPLSTRMTAIEVFKGPSSLRYGPNTIGGTVNMLTRRIPYGHEIGGDLALGTELYGKAHGHYGYGSEHWGVLVEGVQIRSDGFKDLDAPSWRDHDTGFDKIETMAKARVNTDPAAAIYNEGLVKFTYSREVSNETYLGISDADFAATPFRRYAASQIDRMGWQRFGIEVTHGLVVRDRLTLRTTAYRHDFHRAWRKINRLQNERDGITQPDGSLGRGPTLFEVLQDPVANADEYALLTGARNSRGNDDQLLIGINDRTYVSQGIQVGAALTMPKLGPVDQRLRMGLRVHNDSIERQHTEDGYFMRRGALVRGPEATDVTTDNLGEALAVAGYLVDEVSLWGLMVTPGLRAEYIETSYENRLNDYAQESTQRVLLPGVGAIYQLVDWLAVLGGVHEGFSPVAPGQPEGVVPEVAVNYELGGRLSTKHVGAEAIGFFSDYSNMGGDCTFSAGCAEQEVDSQFNAGEATIFGLELSANADIPTPVDLHLPINASYTFTHAEFDSAFTSSNPEYGVLLAADDPRRPSTSGTTEDVYLTQEGDHLPYVPTHQFAATVGFASERWGGLNVGATFVDSMREIASQGELPESLKTDAFVVFDASAQLKVLEEMAIYLKVENLLDNHYIISHRPYGARPGRPRFFYAGVKVNIDRK